MTKGTIKPELLAYVMLDVQSAGFTIPLEKIEASGPFLRAKVTVNGLLNSSGVAYDPINLVEKFLEPAAAAAFNTAEWASLAERLFKNYQHVSTEVETLAAELKGSDMHNNEKTKRIMDPVIQPLVEKVCGRDQKFAQSGLPESWKNMVMEIDRAAMKWAQKTGADNPKELNRIRKNALVLIIATRGLLPSLSPLITSFCAKAGVRSTKLNAYISSYFSFHIENLLVDIMLSREDDKGEKVDIEARKILRGPIAGDKLKSNPRSTNSSAKGNLSSIKTLKNTKSGKMDRITADPAIDKARLEDERNRLDFFKNFIRNITGTVVNKDKSIKKAGLLLVDSDFYRGLKDEVVGMSRVAYVNFEADPVAKSLKYVEKFFGDNPDAKMAEKKRQVIAAFNAANPAAISALRRYWRVTATAPTVAPAVTTATSMATTSTTLDLASSVIPPFPTEDDLSDDDAVNLTSTSTTLDAASSVIPSFPTEDDLSDDDAVNPTSTSTTLDVASSVIPPFPTEDDLSDENNE